jgi:biotin carboxylase
MAPIASIAAPADSQSPSLAEMILPSETMGTVSPKSVFVTAMDADTVEALKDGTEKKTVIMVDPLSTGVLLQRRLFQSGDYRIILVWSDRSQLCAREKHFERSGHPKEDFAAIITHEDGKLEETLAQILAVSDKFHAIFCGSEFGVLLEDAIAEGINAKLGTNTLRGSGLPNAKTKVDKHIQASTIRAAGLDAVREYLVFTEDDVQNFLNENVVSEDASYVVKPQTGSGSVGVMFAKSAQQVWDAYRTILAGEHKAHVGDKYRHYTHAGVLIQEYLAGTEFIVNTVLRDGVPKTTAMFKYDKRPYNGAAFVCFSKELIVVTEDPKYLEICEYTEKVLEAVGFRNGAIHGEVMYVPNRGPVLVELNCRLHGGNAAWVRPAQLCMHYDQLSVLMDTYLDGGVNMFDTIPARPVHAYNFCHQVKMRTHISGIMDSVIPEQMARIQALPSYLEHFVSVRPGDKLLKTVDMPSVPGEVTLVHEDKDILAADYNKLNEILAEGIFTVKA